MEKARLVSPSRHILYIDDDPIVCSIVQCCLERFNHWQVTTIPGAEALEQAKAHPWDAIVLEIARFDGKGWELYDQLRMDLKTQTMPLLLLTSKVMRSDYQKYAQMAIAGVIAKPFDPVALGDQIAHLLGWEISSNRSPEMKFQPVTPQRSRKSCPADPPDAMNLRVETMA